MPDAPSRDGMVLYRGKRVPVAERDQLREEHAEAQKAKDKPPEVELPKADDKKLREYLASQGRPMKELSEQ